MPRARNSILVAPDSFKGTLAARAVADAIARGLAIAGRFDGDLAPVGDGGEGTVDVLLDRAGGRRLTASATDPLGRAIEASFGLSADGATAMIEVAAASGLHTIAPGERDALAASSAGTGALILAAIDAGAQRILLAAGGSATTDGGAGAIDAIEHGGGLRGVPLTVLCDVRTPFELAASRFGAQKGADDPTIRRLSARLATLAARLPLDPRGIRGTGAAGGLAGGLWATYGARLVPGASFVLDALDFESRLRAAHAVIVGEGRLDATTLEGKIAGEIATRARQLGVPAHAVVAINAMTRFDARILDLGEIVQAGDLEAIEAAGAYLSTVI